MEAFFNIKAEEFDESFFSELKAMLGSGKNLELTIAITDSGKKGMLRKETSDEYFSRLDDAVANINNGKSISFTPKELDDFSKQLLNEP
jgi:hypothetical protein